MLAALRSFSDDDLVTSLKTLIGQERDVTAQVVAHIAELDTREVYVREGYRSLYVYCRDALGLSEWEAYARIEVARAARRFPLILDLLADGSVHLTAVKLLAAHLTPDNHREVLESARGKTKLDVQEIVARLAPRPDVPASVRRVTPASSPTVSVSPAPSVTLATESPDAATPPTIAPAPLALTPAARASVAPLSPDRYKLQVTIGGDTLEKLRCAQDMLGHAIPSGEEAAVLDRALTVLLLELAKTKFASTPNPRPSRGTKAGETSAAVRARGWYDCGRCRYVGAGGPLRGAALPRVPSPRPQGAGRRGDRRHHRAEMPASQRLRRTALVRQAAPVRPTGSRSGQLGPEPVRLSVPRSSP